MFEFSILVFPVVCYSSVRQRVQELEQGVVQKVCKNILEVINTQPPKKDLVIFIDMISMESSPNVLCNSLPHFS